MTHAIINRMHCKVINKSYHCCPVICRMLTNVCISKTFIFKLHHRYTKWQHYLIGCYGNREQESSKPTYAVQLIQHFFQYWASAPNQNFSKAVSRTCELSRITALVIKKCHRSSEFLGVNYSQFLAVIHGVRALAQCEKVLSYEMLHRRNTKWLYVRHKQNKVWIQFWKTV